MISHLSGIVASKDDSTITIDVQGVGYLIYCSSETARGVEVGEPAHIVTYLAVRETSLELFGFSSTSERNLFILLLDVPGIGPRSALAITALAPVGMLARAIQQGDSTALTKVSGVGKKSAEKIVIELKDKVGHLVEESDHETTHHNDDIDALEALTMLGYSQSQSRTALQQIPQEITGVQQRLKEALRILGR